MFSIKTFSDVVAVAKTFGVDALHFAVKNNTLNHDAKVMIRDCFNWASNPLISVVSSNDGNNEYSIDALFTRENVAGTGVIVTSLDDIEIIRAGFGAFRMSARQALQRCEITRQDLENILNSVHARNEAAFALGLE